MASSFVTAPPCRLNRYETLKMQWQNHMTARIRTYLQPTSGHTAEIEARRAKRARRAAKRIRDAARSRDGKTWSDHILRSTATGYTTVTTAGGGVSFVTSPFPLSPGAGGAGLPEAGVLA